MKNDEMLNKLNINSDEFKKAMAEGQKAMIEAQAMYERMLSDGTLDRMLKKDDRVPARESRCRKH